MNKVEQLTRIKRRLSGIDSELLSECYDDAAAAICDYCNRNEVPESAAGLLRELTMIYCRANDRVGISSRSEGAISESYTAETIPADIKARLNGYRLLKTARRANHEGKES